MSLTSDLYSHVAPAMLKDAAEALERALTVGRTRQSSFGLVFSDTLQGNRSKSDLPKAPQSARALDLK
jgi:hypothetical protein